MAPAWLWTSYGKCVLNTKVTSVRQAGLSIQVLGTYVYQYLKFCDWILPSHILNRSDMVKCWIRSFIKGQYKSLDSNSLLSRKHFITKRSGLMYRKLVFNLSHPDVFIQYTQSIKYLSKHNSLSRKILFYGDMFRLFWVIFRPFKEQIQVYQCLRRIVGSRTLYSVWYNYCKSVCTCSYVYIG